MRRRQILAILLAAAMTVQLAACGAVDGTEATAESTEATTETDAGNSAITETAAESADADADSAENADADSTEAADAETATDTTDEDSVLTHLPEIGDEIHGFTVTGIREFHGGKSDARLVTMEYEQTGTQVAYIACDDTDKMFRVAYHTATTSDKGLPHIFEHVTLSGGSKYPNADLFDRLASSAYKTDINANTLPTVTQFYISSLDDDQLLALSDFYLDGLFSPMALEDERPLGREAYRLVLADKDDDITVTGAVYNELESDNAGINPFTNTNLWRLLRPGSADASIFGGYRDDIITVTTEELQAFHDQYYHPSNMLVMLYGNLDYERYLELVESYIKDYDRQDITVEDGYTAWTGSKEVSLTYPDVAGAPEEDASKIVYAISLDGISLYDRTLMIQVIPQILSAGYLQAAIDEAFPSASLSINTDVVHTHPAILFTLDGANPDDGEQFRQIVDDVIDDICDNGLDEDLVDTLTEGLANQNITQELTGDDICTYMSLEWSIYGDALSLLDYVQACDEFVQNAENGHYQELIETWLQDPAQTVLLTCNPEAGLNEQVDAAFEEKLATMKANMTDEEIDALVDATADYAAWSEEQAAAADQYVDELRVTDLQSLPEDITTVDVSEETTKDGVRVLTSTIDDMKYVETDIYLNADTLTYDEIHDLQFLSGLIGELPTENYSKDALQTAITGDMISFGLQAYVTHDAANEEAPHPYLAISLQTMSDNTADALALVKEMLETSNLTNADDIRSAATYARYITVNNLSNNPVGLASLTGLAALDDNYRYEYYLTGPAYLDYLSNVASMTDDEMEVYLARLQTVRDRILNTNGMIYTTIGKAEDVKAATANLETLTKGYSHKALDAVDHTADLAKLDLPAHIAVATDNSVNFNGVFASAEDTGLATGKGEAAFGLLRGLQWYPMLRYTIGAYGFQTRVTDDYSYFVSYRDPDIAPTYDYYDTIPAQIRTGTFTKETVEDGAVNLYSELAYPLSAREAASAEIYYRICNEDETYAENLLSRMQAVKEITVDDIETMADTMQTFLDDGVYVTVGNNTAINKNKDRYDLIITTLIK